MPQLSPADQFKFQRFLKDAVATGRVWGLKGIDGYASCPPHSDKYSSILLFWSTEEEARDRIREPWSTHVAKSIGLHRFLDTWLPNMMQEGILAGLNWNSQLRGPTLEAEIVAETFARMIR